MDEGAAAEAASLLLRQWREGGVIEALPERIRPKTRAEGYLVQRFLEQASGQALRGWKIAATSDAGQRHIGVDGPLAGRLLAGMVFDNGAALPFGHNRMRVVEAEFAFLMGRDLAPRAAPYGTEEVLDAVAALHPAIEVPDSRFADFAAAGAAQLIADNACAHQFVLGPEAPGLWRGLDLSAHRVVGHVVGRFSRDGIGANVLGDPRRALTWLANELSRHGETLAAGQVVTTGTCLIPLEIAPQDTIRAEFGILGTVSLRFV